MLDETNKRLAGWPDPTGHVLTVDEKVISIPACGSFEYKTTTSKAWKEGNQQYHYLSLAITKIANSKYPPPCDRDNLQLAARIDDEPDDNEPGWGGGTFTVDNKTEERFRLSGWNPEKRDLSRYGALGEGAAATFELKQVRRDLQGISDRFYKMHGNGNSNPFNVERFDGNALGYCIESTEGEDGLHNPSRAASEVVCELQILKAKFKEFQEWHCDTSPSKKSNGVPCKFPDETIDKSSNDSE